MKDAIVIARYNEAVDWVNDVPDNFERYIYEKQLQGLPRSLTNVGRESHTYLYHIVNNYDDISNAEEDTVTFFTQGNVHHHDPVSCIKDAAESALRHGVSRVHAGEYENPVHHAPRYGFRISEWPPGNAVEPNRENLSFGEWFEKHLQLRFPVKQKLMWIPGACFAVRNDVISLRPKTYYEHLLSQVEHHNNPEEGHFFERSWLHIFSGRPRYVREVPALSGQRRRQFASGVKVMQLDDRAPCVHDTSVLTFDDESTYDKNSICVNFVQTNHKFLEPYFHVVDRASATLKPDAVPYYSLTSAINALQCDRAGIAYEYMQVKDPLPDNRASSWLKMATIRKGLETDAKILVMMDSDAWIKDPDALLDWLYFFDQSPQKTFFSDETSGPMSFDENGTKMTINGGLIVFKTHEPRVKNFVDRVWDVPSRYPGYEKYMDSWPFEQICLHRVLHDDPEMGTMAMVAPLHLFNTPAGGVIRHDWTKKFIQTVLLLDMIDVCLKRYELTCSAEAASDPTSPSTS